MKSRYPAILFVAFGFAASGFAPAALAARPSLVYVNADITATGGNSVIALANDGRGNLSQILGSPFATGGTGVAGTGDPLADAQWDSDGEVITNPAGTLLYAVNGHSNNFSGFNINPDGTLSLIAGSPFPSGGPQPSSLGFLDNALGNGVSTLVVANKDSDPFQTPSAPTYATFRVGTTGVPTLNPGSIVTQPVGSSPSHLIVPAKSKRNIFGILYFGKQVASYQLSKQGIITTLSPLHIVGDPVGGVLHPKARFIYTTIANKDRLVVLSYDAAFNLSLTQTQDSPGNAPCWAAINKRGTRLYTGETLSGSVTVYDLSDPASPTQIQHLVLSGATPFATHTRLDPTEKFLYVLDRVGTLHVLDVAADGTLTEGHTPFDLSLPIGTVPLGLAVLAK